MATRNTRNTRTRAATALPFDIRLMNAVALGVVALAALVLVAAGISWLLRAPVFTLRSITLDGELTRSNLATVRANALPRLAGNFFSLDLNRGRAAFESVPWVRRAIVRRVWPNALAVTLEEHRAVALWEDESGNERLVNDHGEIFEANLGDVEDEHLPEFNGPEGSSAQMLSLYLRLAPLFAAYRMEPVSLHLSGRGSWSLDLDTGATVTLGRGTEDELLARSERFLRTVSQVTERFQRDLEYADLRHADGYAVRLRGITTTIVPATKVAKKSR
jgi:cell division protein FtsQ